MMKVLLIIACLGVYFSACSSGQFNKNGGLTDATPTPTPTPTPPKPEYWKCKVSNGAGRVFARTDEDRDIAEQKARYECGATYRNCILLMCDKTDEEE